MTYNPADVRKILIEELEALKKRISTNIDEAGQTASGKTQETMRVEAKMTEAALTGRQAFSTLERGSRPWVRPLNRPPKWFADIIQQWIIDKNLEDKLNAWAVAATLIKEGSALHRSGGRADIYTPEIQTALENIGTRLGDYFVTIVADKLVYNQEPIQA